MQDTNERSHKRGIRSYVLRQGRLTSGQKQALETHWCDYGIEYRDAPLQLPDVFGNDAAVVLEIGFGNGESLIEQARSNPHKNYLGIEVHRPGVGHCLHLAVELGLSNIRLMNHDATEVLASQIEDHSIDTLQLFFPDPWQKKKHNKRRILQQGFIDEVHRILIDDGSLHVATDWQDYAEHMQIEMDERKDFTLVSTERGERPVTKFEKRGLGLGHGVWDFVYRADR